MIEFFKDWYTRNFSDPQTILLAVFLALCFAVVLLMGQMLAPLLVAIVIAYLLEGLVQKMIRARSPRGVAVTCVYALFIAFMIFIIFGLLPLLSSQATLFFQELPKMISNSQALLLTLPEQYPQFIKEEQVWKLVATIRNELTILGQNVVSRSLASIPVVITFLVYLILGPLLVFFFLKDKDAIINWTTRYLPEDRALLTRVWREMDDQIGNYVRGKFYEIVIVGIASYVVFSLMGLSYAPLLAVLVGISVLVPYIGAAVVTLPVALVAYFQWGWTAEFGWLMFAYGVIQALDGNLLVPLLFSEAVNLHPVAIIVAVLFFGGLWGVLGVFFAIPLATLVKAILYSWPSGETAGMLPQPKEDAELQDF